LKQFDYNCLKHVPGRTWSVKGAPQDRDQTDRADWTDPAECGIAIAIAIEMFKSQLHVL
jgi:hypothetical protein